jgi:hypothetical protein
MLEQATLFGPKELGTLGTHLFEVIDPDRAAQRAQQTLDAAEQRAHHRRAFTLSDIAGTGQVRVHGWLDHESAAIVRAALTPLCTPRSDPTRTPAQHRADALVDLCRLFLTDPDLPHDGGQRPQITLTIEYQNLRDELATATLDDGNPLSATTARRLACDATILPAILDGEGQILDLGRQRRLFTGPIRHALNLRDRGCAFPSCHRPPRWCDAHHITHWANGGSTSLNNAVLLCRHHHRLIHHGTWHVTINPTDGRPDFTPPTYIDPHQQPQRNPTHRTPYHRRQ